MINEGDKHLDDYMFLDYWKDDIIQFASEIFHVFIDDWNKLREKLINWNESTFKEPYKISHQSFNSKL